MHMVLSTSARLGANQRVFGSKLVTSGDQMYRILWDQYLDL